MVMDTPTDSATERLSQPPKSVSVDFSEVQKSSSSSKPAILDSDVPTLPTQPATSSPVELATPSPVQLATPSPVESATPSPVQLTTPSPVEPVTPSPVQLATPSPVEPTTPSPIQLTTPSPVEPVTPSPVQLATPSLIQPATTSLPLSAGNSNSIVSQAVIDLTVEKGKTVTPRVLSVSQPHSKSLLPNSASPFTHLGVKRSPSPSFMQHGLKNSSLASSNKASIPSHSLGLPGQSLPPGISFSQLSNLSVSAQGHMHETGPPAAKRKRLFHRELMSMMRGFGDDPNPHSETVDLIEELVIRFITEMTQKAMEVGKSGRVQVNDIIFMIRKDQKKYSRVKDLLTMKEQIDKAKKAFTEDAETSDDMS